MKALSIRKMVLAALFLAIGMFLPFLTGQIPQIGSALLPLHLPALLCGYVCGWPYGLAVGFILPLLRCLLFGMPPFFTALAMAFELAAYGCMAGFLYRLLPKKPGYLYISLVGAMITGRVVWGVVRSLLSGASESGFTWAMFMSGAVLNAIPGIILQLILVPILVMTLQKLHLIPKERVSAGAMA